MMRFLLLLVVVSLCVGCAKKEENTNYLKTQQFELSQPKISTSSTIIDSSIVLSADFRMENAELFYTKDGAIPTKESSLYKKPLQITEAGLYRFKAFHPDWKSSAIAFAKVYKKGHQVSTINWETQVNEKYPGVGDNSLFNNKKAAVNFRDNQWVGYDTNAKATVNFEKKTFVKQLTVGYLIDTKSWIFPPESVTVYFNKIDSIHIKIPKIEASTKRLNDVEIPINKELESIQISVQNLKQLPKWHPGADAKAWLFMDEWIFN